jgi:hypothetical protein
MYNSFINLEKGLVILKKKNNDILIEFFLTKGYLYYAFSFKFIFFISINYSDIFLFLFFNYFVKNLMLVSKNRKLVEDVDTKSSK